MRMQAVAGTQCRDAMWKAAHMSTAICFTATGQTRTKSCPHHLFHNALGRTENALFALAARAGVSYCDHCCRPAHAQYPWRHSGRTSFFGFRFLCTQNTRGSRKGKMRGGLLHPEWLGLLHPVEIVTGCIACRKTPILLHFSVIFGLGEIHPRDSRSLMTVISRTWLSVVSKIVKCAPKWKFWKNGNF